LTRVGCLVIIFAVLAEKELLLLNDKSGKTKKIFQAIFAWRLTGFLKRKKYGGSASGAFLF